METSAETAKQVMRYIQSHPDASDTLEGIGKWWVTHQRITECVGVVKEALEILKAEGSVAEMRTAEGRILYSAARPDKV